MKAENNFLKLVEARLSQKSYEAYQKNADEGVEIDKSIFDSADFNDDGKVDDKDLDLIEEIINSSESDYEKYFNSGDITNFDFITNSPEGEKISDEEKEYLESIQEALNNYANTNKTEGVQPEQNAQSEQTEEAQAQDEEFKAKQEELNKIKEECEALKTAMDEAQKKYEQAVAKTKNAKAKQESKEARYKSEQSKYESMKTRYSETLRKKMSADNQAKKSGSKSKTKNSYDEQLREVKKKRDKANRDTQRAFSDYTSASANVAYYNSREMDFKTKYNTAMTSYTAGVESFNSIYNGLSEEQKAIIGENPFTATEQ